MNCRLDLISVNSAWRKLRPRPGCPAHEQGPHTVGSATSSTRRAKHTRGPYRWPMSVFIKLVENRPPKEYANDRTADISYDDTAEGNAEITYQYDVLPGGILRILRVTRGEEAVIHAVYAPGLWFRVEGLCRGTTE